MGENQIIAVAWFRREDWDALRAVAADELDETFDEFAKRVERKLAPLRARGISPVRVVIDVDLLVKFCRHKGCRVDSPARAEYAALGVANGCQLDGRPLVIIEEATQATRH
jgi:hypothetical protein